MEDPLHMSYTLPPPSLVRMWKHCKIFRDPLGASLTQTSGDSWLRLVGPSVFYHCQLLAAASKYTKKYWRRQGYKFCQYSQAHCVWPHFLFILEKRRATVKKRRVIKDRQSSVKKVLRQIKMLLHSSGWRKGHPLFNPTTLFGEVSEFLCAKDMNYMSQHENILLHILAL